MHENWKQMHFDYNKVLHMFLFSYQNLRHKDQVDNLKHHTFKLTVAYITNA